MRTGAKELSFPTVCEKIQILPPERGVKMREEECGRELFSLLRNVVRFRRISGDQASQGKAQGGKMKLEIVWLGEEALGGSQICGRDGGG